MRVSHSIQLKVPIGKVWSLVLKPGTLDYVAWPLTSYRYFNLTPEEWEPGEYLVRVYGFGFIPFGQQTIAIELPKSKEGCKILRDNGYGNTGILRFIKKWDHTIELRSAGDFATYYTDTIEVSAGMLTPIFWAYAYVFYFWRQLRWKSLIKK